MESLNPRELYSKKKLTVLSNETFLVFLGHSDCRVSEIEQLCNAKGEPMLFYVQRKLDVPGTPDRKTWRSLGHAMKVSSDDLDLIEGAYKAEKSPTEILWAKFKTFTPEPTMREFVQALIICQRNDVASYICNWQWE